MCVFCVEIAKGNMNIKEVASAYMELVDDSHTDEILTAIEENYGRDTFLDAILDIQDKYGDSD